MKTFKLTAAAILCASVYAAGSQTTWTSLSGTAFTASMCPPDGFGGSVLPSGAPYPYRSSGGQGSNFNCTGVIETWTGGIARTKAGSEEMWLLDGGGHADYGGNESYMLNLHAGTPTFTRVGDPSTLTAADYNSSARKYPDNKPASRHTYDQTTYVPWLDKFYLQSGATYGLGSTYRDGWFYDPTVNPTVANPWTEVIPSAAAGCVNPQTGGYQPTQGGSAIANTNDHMIYYGYTGNWFFKLDPVTSCFTSFGQVWPNSEDGLKAIFDVSRNRLFLIGGSKGYTKGFDTNPVVNVTASIGAGCAAIVNSYGPGGFYDAVNDLYVLYPMTGGNTLYIIDPKTWACTTQTTTGGPTATITQGMWGRFNYFPTLGKIAVMTQASQGWYTLDYGAPNTTPPPPPVPTITLSQASLSFTGVASGANPGNQSVTLTNSGGAGSTLNWSASSGGTSWLSVAPGNGSLAQGAAGTGLTVSVNTAGLSAGTYNGTLTFTDGNATNSPKTLPVTLTITAVARPSITLSQPSLTFTGVTGGANPGNQSVTLTNSGGAGSTLNWSASPGGAAWLSVAPGNGSLAQGAIGTGLTVSVNTAGLSAGTYNGTLTFTDGNATNSPQGLPITLTVTAAPPVPTRTNGSPSGTLAAGTQSTAISLNTDVSASCKYATQAGTAYGSMTQNLTATNGATTHTATVSGLANGQSYSYYIRCANSQDQTKVNTTDFVISFAVNVPGNQPPTIGSLSATPPDVDPASVGIQEYENTSVTYSATVGDPDGDPITWQWYYTANGGPRIPLASGTSAGTAKVQFLYPPGSAGTQYTWYLDVSDGQALTEQYLNVGVISLPAGGGGGGGGTLVQPQVSFPTAMPINGTLSIANASSYSGVTFQWTFTLIGASGNSVSAVVAASGATAGTLSGAAIRPITAGLSLGTYRISVVAVDGAGNASAAATGQVALVNANLSSVKVYPNPWRSDKHASYPSMTFDGLSVGTTVKIFTVSGHKTKELHTDGPKIAWDLTNDSGDKVASGVYLYTITDMAGDKVKGKVAVIK